MEEDTYCEIDQEGQAVRPREVGQARKRFLTEEYAVMMEYVDAILAHFRFTKGNLH